MDKATMCPPGTQILTEYECNIALKWAPELGITLTTTKDLVYDNDGYENVPHGCSYKYKGDKAFHFNPKLLSSSNAFIDGTFHMICKKGKRYF